MAQTDDAVTKTVTVKIEDEDEEEEITNHHNTTATTTTTTKNTQRSSATAARKKKRSKKGRKGADVAAFEIGDSGDDGSESEEVHAGTKRRRGGELTPEIRAAITQKKLAHHSGSTTCFVTALDPSLTVAEIRSYFACCPGYRGFTLLTDQATGASKCTGFVFFETADQARVCVAKTDGKKLKNHFMQVSQTRDRVDKYKPTVSVKWASTDKWALTVKGLDTRTTQQQVTALFKKCPGFKFFKLTKKHGISVGIGLATFQSENHLVAAKLLLKDETINGKPFMVFRKDLKI
ncbi:hypothetical protein Pelo_5051 [Pelomyxa schiedti]|nr:hypothetical protein Pelo_5051 [Pelomyxa schiedti]